MPVTKLDASAQNPFARRTRADSDDDLNDDYDESGQTQSLLSHRPALRPASPSKYSVRSGGLKPSSLRLYLLVAIGFCVGIVTGISIYGRAVHGMSGVSEAISAAHHAQRNADVAAGADSDTVITRVIKDAFPLRIMTFNLRYGTAKDGANSWQFRRAHAADIINRYLPVVFGTQEGLAQQLDELQKLLARPYERFGEAREPNGEHVQIFYDSTVVEKLDGGTFWLSPTPDVPGSKGWDAVCVRIATWCRFRLRATRQEFYYVNTHLDSEGPVARYEGAKVVWHEMQKILKRDSLPTNTPLLMTGDFNTFRPSNVYKYLTADAEGPKFQDSWLASDHRIGNISCTFHEFQGPKFDTVRHDDWHDPAMDQLNHVAANHIDFILSRPPLLTPMMEVITEAWDGRYPSDHYPVFATLLFPSAEELPPA